MSRVLGMIRHYQGRIVGLLFVRELEEGSRLDTVDTYKQNVCMCLLSDNQYALCVIISSGFQISTAIAPEWEDRVTALI